MRLAMGHYLALVLAYPRFLAFGFTMTLASAAGQTYFIGIFGPSIRAEFGLSHTAWSSIYMAGTLMSALLLPWSGQQIDRFPLRTFALAVAALLVIAASFMALVPAAWLLVPAIFLLRQSGQGLCSHTGTTAMARHFSADRGKAVAIVSLGFSVGEAVLPLLAVLAISAVGWRLTYGGSAIILALLLPAAICWLLSGQEEDASQRQPDTKGPARSWTRAEVLRHRQFYLMLPAVMAIGFIGTALFFHHLAMAEAKGWTPAWITGSYGIYAVASVLVTLGAGPLIDRFSAVKLLPGYLVPLMLGLMLLWAFDHKLVVWPYMVMLGISSGFSYIGITALWAEVYGTAHLGAIRSLAVAVMVFGSALGPLAMGAMMDLGVTVESIAAIFAGYCLLATAFLIAGLYSAASS